MAVDVLEDKVVLKGEILFPRLAQDNPQISTEFNKHCWTVKLILDDTTLPKVLNLFEKHKVSNKVSETKLKDGTVHKHTIEIRKNAKPFIGNDGKAVTRKAPVVVDAKNNKMSEDLIGNIGNGTIANVAFSILKHPGLGTGYVSLSGVQIIELKEFNSSGSLFGEEDGFTASLDNDVSPSLFGDTEVTTDDLNKI